MLRSSLVFFLCCAVLSVAQKECGPNAVYDCVFSCPPQKTCRDREATYYCLDVVELCRYQCVCKEGFYRNFDDGDCITEKECDKCTGANEYYACGGPCDNVCSTLDTRNKTSCPYTDCKPSCYCDDGYARDDSGKCVPIEECRKNV